MNKQVLSDQFNSSYDNNAWFISVRKALEGLTAEQADKKPEGVGNSIWELVAHLSYYNNAYLQRFKGTEFEYDFSGNDETFKGSLLPSEEEWAKTVGKFDSIMTEWRQLLRSADEDKFGQPVSAKNPAKWAEIIANINTHNAYHAGQIVLIRKLQGNWDPEQGVS